MAPKRKAAFEHAYQQKKCKLLNGRDALGALPFELLNKWAWGKISSVEVQEISKAAQLSGLECPQNDVLAGLGMHGENAGSINRDLWNRVSRDLLPPPQLKINIPIKDCKASDMPVDWECGLNLPSMWIQKMFSDANLEFEMDAFFCLSAIRDGYWDRLDFANSRMTSHPVRKTVDWKNCAIPLVLHGDGAQFMEKDSLVTVSMSGLFKIGNICETNVILASWPKRSTAKGQGGTWDTIWDWIVWDLNALYKNKYPKAGPHGETLTGCLAGKENQTILTGDHAKYTFFLFGICGDMEYFQNELGLPHHGKDERPCHLCCGNKKDCNWFDFRKFSPWKPEDESVGALPLKEIKHPLTKVIGWSSKSYLLDWLHVVDLGVAAHMLGNVFYDLAFYQLPRTRRENIDFLVDKVMTFKGKNGSPPSTFAAKNFIDMQKPFKDYPEMRYLKAANIRYLVPLASELCREYGAKDALGKHQLAAMVGLMACYDLLHTERKVLTKTLAEAMKTHGLQFLLNYSACAKLCEDSPDNRYSVVPKFHYFFHLLEQAVDVNPHFTWCYGGEDLVGKASSLAHSCTRGTANHKVGSSMMDKYRVAMHLKWSCY